MIYNKHLKKYIEVNEGEELCEKCKGRGLMIHRDIYNECNKPYLVLLCDKCKGKGKIDWVEKVVGVKVNV